jgi:hypothetical protein
MGLLLLGAFWAGSVFQPERGASAAGKAAGRAAGRQPPPPQPFLAGSERALPILQEIAATLKRIDDRLARIEKLMAVRAAQRPGGQPEQETK